MKSETSLAGLHGGAGNPLSEKVRSLRISQSASRGAARSTLPWLFCLLLAGSTGYFAYMLYGVERPEGEPRTGDAPATESTSTRSASSSKKDGCAGAVLVESKGYIIPRYKILLSPKVNGMVKYLRIQSPGKPIEKGVPLEEGMHVNAGDLLAQLESTDYEADVARARAALASAEFKLDMERKNLPNEIERAQSELSEAETNRDYLKTVVDRNDKLAKTVAVSPSEIEKARSEYDAAVHRVQRLTRSLELITGPRVERIKVAEADVQQATAEVTKSEWRLGNCMIVAPVAGTILKKTVEEGNIVNPVALQGSYSVCEMADLGNLEVELSIQEREVSNIFVGQRCVVRAEAYPERAYKGIVSRLMPIADRAKGAIPVRVKVTIPREEEGIYLKPEMGAVVSFYGKDAPPPDDQPAEESAAESPANPIE